jgi:signal transduction histidine kinase
LATAEPKRASLKARLGVGLTASLLVVFVLQWFLVAGSVRAVATAYVGSRLEHDADNLLAALRFDATGRPLLGARSADIIYERPFSGHYFRLASGEHVLRSRSLWDQDLPTIITAQTDTRRTPGPQAQTLLLLTRMHMKQDRVFTLSIAEDLSGIEADIDRFTARYTLVSAIALALLLALQGAIVYVSLRPVDRLRADVRRLERGEIGALREDAPSEIAPLVHELNHLLALMGQRLQRARLALGNLAHALKTPLTLLTDAAADRALEAQPALRARVQTQVETLRRLIDRELKRARVAGAAVPGQRLDLAVEVPRLVATLREIYRERPIDIHYILPDDAAYAADREDVFELLGNLLDNACKWARSEVRLSMDTAQRLAFTIEDDGPGVAPDEITRLAQRGARLDENMPGHGLGLAIARDIVESYGGDMDLDRSPELGGLRVHITLPLSRA